MQRIPTWSLIYSIPAFLFLAFATYYAAIHGGEILVFAGVAVMFLSMVLAALTGNRLILLLVVVGLLMFVIGALWHPTQQVVITG